MASPKQLLLDQWTGLAFKRGIPRLESRGDARGWLAPSWVGEQNERRLAAYKVLYAIFRNAGREFLNTNDEEERAQHREYGDANLLVKVVLAAVLGDDISIAVEGADDEKNAAAVERQAWLEKWAKPEQFRLKVMEAERDAQKLGDGVYMLGINYETKRVHLRCIDAGFYFPELDPNLAEDQFPRRVHIAWEYEERDSDSDRRRADPRRPRPGHPREGNSTTMIRKVRRITWELATTPDGERRDYPWNDEPSTTTCYMTDATWLLGDLDGFDVERFPMSRATPRLLDTAEGPVAVDALDLRIDFIPVIHLPNTVEIKEHFGEALVTAVAQILDDLARADTDASKAAQLAGVPMLGAAGIAAADVKVKAGSVLGLGQSGSLTVVDLSAGLRACMEYVRSLRDRLNENVRVPAEVVGRVEASQDRSGIHLALSFGPMRSLIEEMRLVRNEKYPLLLKFVQRMSVAAGYIDGDVLPAEVKFGSFLPTDKAAIVDLVIKLWEKHIISRQTALQQLVDEGVLDVEVAEELALAEADDVEMAIALRDATEGDFDAVYELLHRDRPEDEEPEPAINPTIPLPPVPGRGAGAGGAPPIQ